MMDSPIITLTAKRYSLTLALNTVSVGTSHVLAVVQNTARRRYCIAQITYEQAALLLIKSFKKPSIVEKRINELLDCECVELCSPKGQRYMFSELELLEVGLTLDFIGY
ncbi:MAG TPA: hypothetical protein VNW54_00880 [Granulicella sp.]|jgi:hypothetical protein|nr:hypothetical protein [Granulicella sp.]